MVDHGGGILLYIREGLNTKRRIDLEVNELESVCVEITTKNGKFIIASFYTPPNAPVTSWDHFERLIDNIVNTAYNVILLGDINVDLLRSGPTNRVSRICQR